MSRKIKIRPSRGESLFGFIVGIILIFIGAITIPVFGVFGIFWTIIVIVITCINGVNTFTDKGIATKEIIIDDTKLVGEYKSSMEQRLLELQGLYDKNLISKDEYEQRRKRIIDNI